MNRKAVSGLAKRVYNRRRRVWFGTYLDEGWFSAAPDDTSVNRAIRTNNPGALNISAWQRERPGYVGQTQADSAGNITTIYQTPEDGVGAWYFLLFDRYGFGQAGQFDVISAARKYAGGNATIPQIRAYVDGWGRWSGGVLKANTVIHFAARDELLLFAKAVFAHEAGAESPVTEAQIRLGFDRSLTRKARKRAA